MLKKGFMNISSEKWKYDACKVEELVKENGYTVHN
jgi:hypothetical protein